MGQAWQWNMNYKFLLISSRSLITWRQNVLFRCHATRRRRRRSYEGPFDKSTVAFLPPSLKDWDERNGQSRNMHKIYSRIITQISFYFSQFVLRWDVLHIGDLLNYCKLSTMKWRHAIRKKLLVVVWDRLVTRHSLANHHHQHHHHFTLFGSQQWLQIRRLMAFLFICNCYCIRSVANECDTIIYQGLEYFVITDSLHVMPGGMKISCHLKLGSTFLPFNISTPPIRKNALLVVDVVSLSVLNPQPRPEVKCSDGKEQKLCVRLSADLSWWTMEPFLLR